MKAALSVAILLASAGTAGASWSECNHRSPREATVQAQGARRIRVIAGAGDLKIHGQAGASTVAVHGTACSSRESGLDEIKVIAERRGDEIYVEAAMPDEWLGGARGLDLVLDVPSSLPLDVEDGSGSAEIRDVAALKIEDGSGELRIEDVAGEVRVTDGSGDIVIDRVGSVVVESDGSGSMRINGVKGSVVVHDDGSGSIDVSDVGGDFAVEHDGSGGIAYDGVRGGVTVPRRHR